MPDTDRVHGQRLIVYEQRAKSTGVVKEIAYTTAYTDDQAKAGVVACVEQHGKGARCRCIPEAQFKGK